MASQLPDIVSNVGGNVAIIEHNVNGMLFSCNSHDSFSKCVDSILYDKKKGVCLGQQALLTVKKNYSFDNMLNQYRQFY